MSKTKGLIVLLCSAALCSHDLHAQPRTMGIDELLSLADANSQSIRAYTTGTEAAGEALKAAKANRLPDISASASASYLANGRLWDRDFGNALTIGMPHFGNNFAIEARQTIYAGGAIDGSIRLAELGRRQAELDREKNRQDTRFELLGCYLDLYKLNNQARVLENNIELAQRVIADMRARREQGTALKNDITRYELQVECLRLQLTKVTDAATIANHKLTTTLHLPVSTLIVPDTAMAGAEVAAEGEAYWQAMADMGNIDIKQAANDIEANSQKARLERAGRLPKVAMVAADHLDGPITIEVPALDNNFNYWSVGLSVSYDISSLFKNTGRLKQARLKVRQAAEMHSLARERVENAVQAGYTNFMTAFKEVDTHEKNVQLADENYHVTNNRYRNGLALLTDLLDAANAKLGADLALADARINVIFNYYRMRYLTHTL